MGSTEIVLTRTQRGEAPEGGDGTLYPWWSFSKVVIAAAALRLVANGRLALDADVGETGFTLRHLLQHQSGLRDYVQVPAYTKAVAAGERAWPAGEMWDKARADDLLFVAGGGWLYSNLGFWLVRRLIQSATDLSLDDALKALVFVPLGIKGPRLAETAEDLAATGWGNETGYDPAWTYHGLLIGSGADACRTLDHILWSDFLPDFLRREMQTPFTLPGTPPGRPWAECGYGLGLMIGLNANARSVAGHSGSGHGSSAAVFALLNGEEDGNYAIAAAFAPGADLARTEQAAFNALA